MIVDASVFPRVLLLPLFCLPSVAHGQTPAQPQQANTSPAGESFDDKLESIYPKPSPLPN